MKRRCVRAAGLRYAGAVGVPRIAGAIALLLPVALVACGGSEHLPSDLRFQTAHFDYLTRASDESICPDLAGPLEDHFAVLQGYLGFDWPAGRKVTYHKFDDAADFAANNQCPAGSIGCTRGSDVRSMNGLDTHELIHAYLWPTGDPPGVLAEGAAVALSCESIGYYPRPTETWDQLAGDLFSATNTTVYRDGVWLVGYLLDVFGPQPFMTLYATIPGGADAAAMDAAFQTVYGQSLADIWAAALADSEPRYVCVWQCSRPPIALDGSPFDTTGVCGAASDRPFTLTGESIVSFSTTDAVLQLGPCGQVNPPGDGHPGGAMAIYDLPAGAYYLEHAPVPGTITAGVHPAALSPTCAGATDVAALPAGVTYVSVPSSQPSWFMPLRAPLADGAPPTFGLINSGDSPSYGTADVCSSCDLTDCTSTNEIPPWVSGQVLRYTSDPSQPYNEFYLAWF